MRLGDRRFLFCSRTWFAVFGGCAVIELKPVFSRACARELCPSSCWRVFLIVMRAAVSRHSHRNQTRFVQRRHRVVSTWRQDELAVKQLAMLTGSDIRIGRDALLTGGAATMRAASCSAHRTSVCGACADNVHEFRDQLRDRGATSQRSSRERRVPPFVRTWRVYSSCPFFTKGSVLAAGNSPAAPTIQTATAHCYCWRSAPQRKWRWWIHHEEDPPANVDGDLKDAERHYRQALILSPDLVEARVRLGHVLALRNDDESMRVFEQIGEGIEVPYRYLARPV